VRPRARDARRLVRRRPGALRGTAAGRGLAAVRVLAGHPRARAGRGTRGGPPARPARHDRAPVVRRDGRHRVRAARAVRVVRPGLVATARPAAQPVVPAGHRAGRCARRRGAGGGLGDHRGRAPAVDRRRVPAHPRRGHHVRQRVAVLRRHARAVRGGRCGDAVRAAAAAPPVGGANHVWLIFCLVMLWTAFPPAFAAIMTTLYVPLGLAALGIVVRGCGFAFRKVVVDTPQQRAAGAAFAASSVITPFFLGTVAGAIASGRVPSRGSGNPVTGWLNPTSLLGGVLAVIACAFVAAVFLASEANRLGDADLEAWYRRRARAGAVVTGTVALAGTAVLRADAPHLLHGLLTRGLP